MSKMIEIDWRPDAKTLRHFGWIAFFGFGFLATIAWYERFIFAFGLGDARPIVAGVFGGLAVLSALFSLVFPKANLPITPVGLLFRVIGRDPMHRRFEPAAATYWADPRPRRGKESYFRQF